MQFFIHCNFFCQEYKFTYYLLTFNRGGADSTLSRCIIRDISLKKGLHHPRVTQFCWNIIYLRVITKTATYDNHNKEVGKNNAVKGIAEQTE